MAHLRLLAAAAGISILAAGMAAPALAQDEERPLGPPSATPNPVALEVPAGDGTAVRLTTELGDVVIGLFNESAPVAAENFLNLAQAGYYDGVGFHRAVPGFVLQGGDPDGTGMGGPGYTIPDEEVVGEYGRGIVAMARTQEPNSQGSQFFVILDDEAEAALEAFRTYTIFGRVVEGMDVVDAIVEAREPADQIADPVRILSTSVEQVELPPEPSPAPPTAAELAADALVAQLPDEAAGYQLQKVAFTLEDVGGQFDRDVMEELQGIAEANDADAQLLSIAQAGGQDAEGGFISLAGASIPGVPAEQVQDAMIRLLLPTDDSTGITTETIADREVTRVDLVPDPGPGESAYVVSSGEAVWVIVSPGEALREVVAALP
ncbi:MAG TPA: peptidylprolyl isomerase [Anaerolineae bacterium]|nr:peptidylprolyl isomerase [Anaerolineae bacterium]